MRSIEKSLDPLESGQQPEEKMLFPNEVKTTINERSQPTRRGLYIALMTMALTIFQGIIVVQVYLEPLFRRAVPNLSSTVCCLLFAVTIVVASFAAAFMSDLAGRRPLIIYSSIGGTICCVLLGSQLQLDWGPGWLTALVLYVFCAVYSFGGGTVPFVLIAEVFLPEVKSFMTMLVVEWFWLCSFLSLIIFNPLMLLLGLGGVFYVFAAVCVVTAVMSAIYVPETKGLTLEAVQLMLAERRNF
ncbi:sugar transporter ERD6-like 8 [Ostrinia furnacalis]|uniref:sugar transporter ERD6-like 8 n=1 Tax=Ostrinia furnacalis TaxID=93504 RepID=UPI00103D7D81|nr:sugar transporter ERD6-like 8 [Ostrinia furnacalis]